MLKNIYFAVVELRSRLSLWRGKNVSFESRLVLINSVLNSILLFLFLFYRAPKFVLHDIFKIHRAFVWKGKENRRRIDMVNWEDISRSKSDVGLGIKNRDLFNMALLSKWAWKIISNQYSFRDDILAFRCRNIMSELLEPSRFIDYVKSSLWWRDLKATMGQ